MGVADLVCRNSFYFSVVDTLKSLLVLWSANDWTKNSWNTDKQNTFLSLPLGFFLHVLGQAFNSHPWSSQPCVSFTSSFCKVSAAIGRDHLGPGWVLPERVHGPAHACGLTDPPEYARPFQSPLGLCNFSSFLKYFFLVCVFCYLSPMQQQTKTLTVFPTTLHSQKHSII